MLKKDNRGYDLNQLLIGAEGTLGIVTAASLRLVPAVAARAVAWVGLATPQGALDLLRAMEARTRAVESFEIVPASALALVLAHVPGARAPLAQAHPWNVLVEAVASGEGDEPPAQLLERLLAEALESGLAADAVIAASEAQAEGFWRIRDSISEAERAAGLTIQHDISVPIPDMPRFMVEGGAAVEARFPGTMVSAYGHLGDGNVHFHVRAPQGADRDHWYPEHAPGITRFVHDLVVAAGGSISASTASASSSAASSSGSGRRCAWPRCARSSRRSIRGGFSIPASSYRLRPGQARHRVVRSFAEAAPARSPTRPPIGSILWEAGWGSGLAPRCFSLLKPC